MSRLGFPRIRVEVTDPPSTDEGDMEEEMRRAIRESLGLNLSSSSLSSHSIGSSPVMSPSPGRSGASTPLGPFTPMYAASSSALATGLHGQSDSMFLRRGSACSASASNFDYERAKEGPLDPNPGNVDLTACFENTALLGVPAILATGVFIAKIYDYQRNGTQHNLGRSGLIYWPSQIAKVVAILALLEFLLTTDFWQLSPLFACGTLILAWIASLALNHQASLYEIRSSTELFIFQLYSVLASLVVLRTLYREDQERKTLADLDDIGFKAFTHYTVAVVTAFIIEAWPRGHTKVQIQSGANAHDKANWFSRITFHYIQPIISLGYQRPLETSDVSNTMPADAKTSISYDCLSRAWNIHRTEAELNDQSPSLARVIAITYWTDWVYLIVVGLVNSTFKFITPVLIQQILQYLESGTTEEHPEPEPRSKGIILAILMFVVAMVVSFLMGQQHKRVQELGLRIRNGLVSMIFRKSLRLSPSSRQKSTAIINHVSTDSEKFTHYLIDIARMVSVPYEIAIATVMLYRILGWSVLVGLFIIVPLTPVQAKVGDFFDETRDAKMEAMDSRVGLMTEVLNGIKITKLYGWEESFKAKIMSYRDAEIKLLRRSGTVLAALSLVFTCLPVFMCMISLSVYSLFGGPGFSQGEINAQLNEPVGIMSVIFESRSALRVACNRIQKFLLLREIDTSNVEREKSLPRDNRKPVVEIQGATLAWAPEGNEPLEDGDDDDGEEAGRNEEGEGEPSETSPLLGNNSNNGKVGGGSNAINREPVLKSINLSIAKGSLTVVVGRVGQGKSSLLSAIIGDMYKHKGTIRVSGSIAYVPQQAWILHSSLRDNIVFGMPFDQRKYDRIIQAAGLLPDLAILPAGDQTEIGERGINLSGGQKQRVSLARAAYLDADIYLLDDPLSAVDAHVDQHLWENLIGPNGLLKDKTRILVTHGIHHLEQVDSIVVLKDGEVSEIGQYSELMSHRKAFFQLISEYSSKHKRKEKLKKNDAKLKDNQGVVPDDASIGSSTSEETVGEPEKNPTDGDLTEEEEVEDHIVGWGVLLEFIKAMTYRHFFAIVGMFTIWEISNTMVPFWLEHWSSVASTTDHSLFYFLSIYVAIATVFMVCDYFLTYVCFVSSTVQAAKTLHDTLLNRVLRLPMSFFDTTPSGRILNRFSSDISSVDEVLPESLTSFLQYLYHSMAVIFVVSYVTPVFLLSLPPMVLVYVILQKYYLRTSSMLRRIVSVTKSPLYEHVGESLNGRSSIRAMGIEDRFILENNERTDESGNAHYASIITNRWLHIRLEFLAALIMVITALLAVYGKGTLSAGMAGLALTHTQYLAYNIIWLLRSYCDLQTELVAVERILDYSRRPTEAPAVTGIRLPDQWPEQGKIEFRNYSTRYRQGMDLVLKNVSFEVRPGEKIGIVGRTGAGKSSLTLALFRIIEAANSYWAKASEDPTAVDEDLQGTKKIMDGNETTVDGGSIWVDGVDISTIGLTFLRQHLAIIPQDPTLFVGTLRENLDPFQEKLDKDLWEALERAHLKDYIKSLPEGLEHKVEQNGENYSVGQRSLICLARALLRETRVLVLDEATSSVDMKTDELIQRTIRSEFKDRTILTIAHRIKTVMDYDKILVLENGRVVEFASPSALLADRSSVFYSLALQAGEISK
ncbi:hypothetical protein BGW41_004478 [Actinomortierella wolfii]|nr:hypothetical protein BGW41_004478 [Actinomortierella wolfii]